VKDLLVLVERVLPAGPEEWEAMGSGVWASSWWYSSIFFHYI
jgi:hypothetical protein